MGLTGMMIANKKTKKKKAKASRAGSLVTVSTVGSAKSGGTSNDKRQGPTGRGTMSQKKDSIETVETGVWEANIRHLNPNLIKSPLGYGTLPFQPCNL